MTGVCVCVCVIAFCWVEVKDVSKHSTCTRQPLIIKSYLVQDVDSTEVEEP